MKKVIEETAASRKAICDDCEWSSKNRKTTISILRPDEHCTNCGCVLDAKRKCLSCSCPVGKWGAIISSDERDQLTEELNG